MHNRGLVLRPQARGEQPLHAPGQTRAQSGHLGAPCHARGATTPPASIRGGLRFTGAAAWATGCPTATGSIHDWSSGSSGRSRLPPYPRFPLPLVPRSAWSPGHCTALEPTPPLGANSSASSHLFKASSYEAEGSWRGSSQLIPADLFADCNATARVYNTVSEAPGSAQSFRAKP